MNENIFDEIIVKQRESKRYMSVSDIQIQITRELENKLAGLGVVITSMHFDSEEGIILISVSQRTEHVSV